MNSFSVDSTDDVYFLSDLIPSDSSSESLFDEPDGANSFPLISNGAEMPYSDFYDQNSPEELLASSNVIGSDVNSLLQASDDEDSSFYSDTTAPDFFSESMIGSDVLEHSQTWLEPSFSLAGNPPVSSADEVSSSKVQPICCGHGESLMIICFKCEFVII